MIRDRHAQGPSTGPQYSGAMVRAEKGRESYQDGRLIGEGARPAGLNMVAGETGSETVKSRLTEALSMGRSSASKRSGVKTERDDSRTPSRVANRTASGGAGMTTAS